MAHSAPSAQFCDDGIQNRGLAVVFSSRADLTEPSAQEGCTRCGEVFQDSWVASGIPSNVVSFDFLGVSLRVSERSRAVSCSVAQEALTLHFAGYDAVTSQASCACEKLLVLDDAGRVAPGVCHAWIQLPVSRLETSSNRHAEAITQPKIIAQWQGDKFSGQQQARSTLTGCKGAGQHLSHRSCMVEST